MHRLQHGWFDADAGALHSGGRKVALTSVERDLLAFLAVRAPDLVDKKTLLAEVWGYSERVSSHTVKTTVSRLRRKLGSDGAVLETVRGKGYRLVPGSAEDPPRGPVTLALLEVHRPPIEAGLGAVQRRLDRALERSEASAAFAFLDGPLHLGLAFADADAATAWALRILQALPPDLPGLVGIASAVASPPHYAGAARDRLSGLCREAGWGEVRLDPSVVLRDDQVRSALEAHRDRPGARSRTPLPVGPMRRRPAPASAEGPPAPVPQGDRWHTAWFGRTDEAAELARLLDGQARAVALVGPGGSGKSRISRRAIQGRNARWVDLTGATHAPSVRAAVAASLGFGSAVDPAQLERALEAQGGWLVLDGCEDAQQAVLAAVERWLDQCPSVRVLLTSQVPLGVPWAVTQRLGPLDPASAAELFCARASASSGLEVVPDDAVRELVAQLDHLPVAIELAAAQADYLGVDGLLARLGDRFELLREDATRHGALEHVVSRTWERLEPEERVAVAWCSVFRGGFSTLEACEVLAHLDGPDRVLAGLVRQAVLEAPGPGTLRLPRSLRVYAARELEAMGARREAERAHAAALLERAPRFAGEGSTAWHRRTQHRLEDLLAAVLVALQTNPDRALRGLAIAVDQVHLVRFPEGLSEVLTAACDHTRALSPRLHARALLCLGIARVRLRQKRGAIAPLEDAASLARSVGDRATEVEALHALAGAHHVWASPAYAEAMERLLPELEALYDPETFALVLLLLITPHTIRTGRADALLARVETLAELSDDPELEVRVGMATARIARTRDDYLGMLAAGLRAREGCRTLGLPIHAAFFGVIAGRGHEAMGQLATARAIYEAAAETALKYGYVLPPAEIAAARCAAREGAVADAQQRLDRVLDAKTSSPVERAGASTEKGLLAELEGRPVDALARYTEALGVQPGATPLANDIVLHTVGVLADLGQVDAAAPIADRAARADDAAWGPELRAATEARLALARSAPDATLRLRRALEAIEASPHRALSPLWAVERRLRAQLEDPGGSGQGRTTS